MSVPKYHTAFAANEEAVSNIQNKVDEFNVNKPENGYMYNYYNQEIVSSIVEIPIHTKGGNKINEIFARATKLNIWYNNTEKLLLESQII